ncbi:MAG: RRXRR domain-containing protein [Desulfovibrio sp.]|nr:RRXRR domain-containing protein [Desulfovibrio sp.]
MSRRMIRSANLCYRAPRFDNRKRRKNRHKPGIQHRVDFTKSFV